MIRRVVLSLFLVAPATLAHAQSTLEIRVGLASVRKPFTAEETQWMELIRTRVDAWTSSLAAIVALYAPAPPPPHVAIILGNRGASDAFTHDPQTIGFDLAALYGAYGAASSAENIDRIDRLFIHEYAHLMQKSWLVAHPYPTDSHFRTALLDVWLEGLGNYHSMSKPWRSTDGMPSKKATETLAIVEPRFCARMAALACATAEGAQRLEADLSQGPFDRKWGGLTLALWLEQEMSTSRVAYRELVLGGPDAIPAMAKRHLPPALAAVFEEAIAQVAICEKR